MKAGRTVAAACMFSAVAACTSVQTTAPGAVGVEREQLMSALVSEEQLEKGSAQAYSEIIGKAREQGELNADPGQVARVRTIADRLIAATPVFRKEAPQWKWETNVIESDQVNAWAMPGGKIAVYSGIIEKLNLTDDELAAIMGHEIAHVLREHGRERASRANTASLALEVLASLSGAAPTTKQLASAATDIAFNLPNSRLQEREADRIGVELAARAGYDPSAAVSLWQKMAKVGGSNRAPEFLSTHPSPEDRTEDLRALSARVMPLYEKAKAG